MKTLIIDTYTTIKDIEDSLWNFRLKLIRNRTEVGNFSFQLKAGDRFKNFRMFLEMEKDYFYYNVDFQKSDLIPLNVIVESRDLQPPYTKVIKDIKRKALSKLSYMNLDQASIPEVVQMPNSNAFSGMWL